MILSHRLYSADASPADAADAIKHIEDGLQRVTAHVVVVDMPVKTTHLSHYNHTPLCACARARLSQSLYGPSTKRPPRARVLRPDGIECARFQLGRHRCDVMAVFFVCGLFLSRCPPFTPFTNVSGPHNIGCAHTHTRIDKTRLRCGRLSVMALASVQMYPTKTCHVHGL